MSHDLQRWFKPVDTLPQPKERLCATRSLHTIYNASEEVHKLGTSSRSSREAYVKVASEQQAKIAQYRSMYGNTAAVCWFSKELSFAIKESSIHSWKEKYQIELQWKHEAGETDHLMKSLPSKQWGWPPLLGEKLDMEVKSYISAVCVGGGVVTSAIVMAAATAIVRRHGWNLLYSREWRLMLTKTWAKSLLHRMGYVKRRGSSTAKWL